MAIILLDRPSQQRTSPGKILCGNSVLDLSAQWVFAPPRHETEQAMWDEHHKDVLVMWAENHAIVFMLSIIIVTWIVWYGILETVGYAYAPSAAPR